MQPQNPKQPGNLSLDEQVSLLMLHMGLSRSQALNVLRLQRHAYRTCESVQFGDAVWIDGKYGNNTIPKYVEIEACTWDGQGNPTYKVCGNEDEFVYQVPEADLIRYSFGPSRYENICDRGFTLMC